MQRLGMSCLSVLLLLSACGKQASKQSAITGQTTADEKILPTQGDHRVRKGEILKSIGPKYDVGWEQLLLINENFLQEKYEDVCGNFHANIQKQTSAAKRIGNKAKRQKALAQVARKRSTLFCNDRYNRPYGNTLLPGWVLKIPGSTAPAQIQAVVQSIVGNRIALVIDDTGSMGDDRRFVGQFYAGAIAKYKKQLTGIYLYADGGVRKYKEGGVQFLNQGDFENTQEALETAAKDRPDAIILVTDEPGDDWNWGRFGRSKLPSVYGHCLPERGRYECKANLIRLAGETGGKYTEEAIR